MYPSLNKCITFPLRRIFLLGESRALSFLGLYKMRDAYKQIWNKLPLFTHYYKPWTISELNCCTFRFHAISRCKITNSILTFKNIESLFFFSFFSPWAIGQLGYLITRRTYFPLLINGINYNEIETIFHFRRHRKYFFDSAVSVWNRLLCEWHLVITMHTHTILGSFWPNNSNQAFDPNFHRLRCKILIYLTW